MNLSTKLTWLLCVALLPSSLHSAAVQSSMDQPVIRGLRIEASDKTIQPSTTKHFSLNCSINPENMTNLATVVSLVVSKWQPANEDFVELALLNYLHPRQVTVLEKTPIVANGNLDTQGISYVSLQWDFPGQEVAGRYRCEANTMDTFGHPDNLQVGLAVGTNQVDLASLTDSVKVLMQMATNQQSVIESMNKTIVSMNTTINLLRKANTIMMNSNPLHFYFNESLGSFILFSSHDAFPTFGDAQSFCAREGGKLVEMTQPDLKSVSNYLIMNGFPENWYWIGWSRNKNDNWVFASLNSSVGPISWDYPPTASRNYYCAMLKFPQLYLSAEPCNRSDRFPAMCLVTF